jgi:hypothetical protein
LPFTGIVLIFHDDIGIHEIKEISGALRSFACRDWEFFASRLQHRTFLKKAPILITGAVEDHVNFIERGIIRYFVLENEKDITFEIAFENSFATAYNSFLTSPIISGKRLSTPYFSWPDSYARARP